MVDLQSKYRLYSIGYTAINPRPCTPTLRELYHENGRKLFLDRKDRPVHDCRAEVMKTHTAPEEWDAWLLSHGLRNTFGDCLNSHVKPRDLHIPPEKKNNDSTSDSNSRSSDERPTKLLIQLGKKGSAIGDFNYPRGVCSAENGDVIVADSFNHRVQIFNRFGIFKLSFGEQGSLEGQLDEPTDVVELPNKTLAVADRRNKRVQIFSDQGKFLYQFETEYPPFSLACDRHHHLVVCTVGRTVEVYTQLQLSNIFYVPVNGPDARRKGNCPLHVGMTEQGEVVVSDQPDQCVKVFNLDGHMLRQFRPRSHVEGLACSPGGLFVTAVGQVLLADVLNHSVSMFTTTGSFLQQVLKPTDEVGCLHSLSVGTEGHLILSEFSVTGDHTVKMFRYRDCACHKGRRLTYKKGSRSTVY